MSRNMPMVPALGAFGGGLGLIAAFGAFEKLTWTPAFTIVASVAFAALAVSGLSRVRKPGS